MKLNVIPDSSGILPTEYAFTIECETDKNYKDSTVEVSRLSILKEFRSTGLCQLAVLAAMGISILDNFKYCLYSCSIPSVKLHSSLLPMLDKASVQQNLDGYPGFKFPKSSTAILSEIQTSSEKNLDQAVLVGIVCRYGAKLFNELVVQKKNLVDPEMISIGSKTSDSIQHMYA